MTAIFTLRLFDKERYLELLPILESLNRGSANASTVQDALEEALKRAQDQAFLEYNNKTTIVKSWPWLLPRVLQLTQDDKLSELSAAETRELTEVLVALLCMPRFQSYYIAVSSAISETCFILGQWDGGLLLFLRQHSPWFDRLFAWDFPFDYAEYPYGKSMALFTREQLRQCREALSSTASPSNMLNKELLIHYNRLSKLLNEAWEVSKYTLALSTE